MAETTEASSQPPLPKRNDTNGSASSSGPTPHPSAPPKPVSPVVTLNTQHTSHAPSHMHGVGVEHRADILDGVCELIQGTTETDLRTLERLVEDIHTRSLDAPLMKKVGVCEPTASQPGHMLYKKADGLQGGLVRRELTGGSGSTLAESPRDQMREMTRETTGTNPARQPPKELVAKVMELPGMGKDSLFVSAVLSSLAVHMPLVDVLAEATSWLDMNRGTRPDRATIALSELKMRFSDGIDCIKNLASIKRVEFWPTNFQYQGDVMALATSLAEWHSPKGFCWTNSVVSDLRANCGVMTTRHLQSQAPEDVVPIYLYTSAMYRRVLWAFWVNGSERWQEYTRTWKELDSAYAEMQRKTKKETTLRLRREVIKFMSIYMKTMSGGNVDKATLIPIRNVEYGLTGFEVAWGQDGSERVFIIRYECKEHTLSPLSNSVAWLCNPVDYFHHETFGIDTHMPPPGVFEYLESRPHDEIREQKEWGAVPVKNPDANALIQRCYAEPNQCRYSELLHMEMIGLLERTPINEEATRPLRTTMEAKLEGKPTPQDIAHALELQMLRWDNKVFVVALSGSPRIVTDTVAPFHQTKVYRVYHECNEQPYFLMNETMRNKQSQGDSDSGPTPGVTAPLVEVSCAAGGTDSGRYLPKEGKPEDLPQERIGLPLTLRHENASNKVLVWNKEVELWELFHRNAPQVLRSIPHEEAKMRLGLWMLEATRPLMWFLDQSLRVIPAAKPDSNGSVKSYRGLANAVLPRDSYMQGGLVMWGAYSSSSVDQATATWFATQEGPAAVFTIRGRSCALIAPWSRFAREKEYLYPPNTCFQVKTLLTEDQQQILGREELQLYELDEVDDFEALTIYITQTINSAITGQGMELVDQLVSVIQFLVNKDLLRALERVLSPTEPVLQQSYGLDIAKRLCALAEIEELPEDVMKVVDKAMSIAARSGQDHVCGSLKDLGADAALKDADGWCPVDHALIGGHRSTAELLLKLGGMEEPREYVRGTSSHEVTGGTLLHRMAELGLQKGVMLLLKMGADPLCRDKLGSTPAFLAFSNEHKEIVHLLSPQKVLPANLLQEMITYWGSSHYACEVTRERFSELKNAYVCAPYGGDWDGTVHEDRAEPFTMSMVEGMKSWRTPLGFAWDEGSVDDLAGDTKFIWDKHYSSKPAEVEIAMPLFVHTCSVYHRTLWAVWTYQPEQVIGGGWRTLDSVATECLDDAFRDIRIVDVGAQKKLRIPQATQKTLSMMLGAAGPDDVIPETLALLKHCKGMGITSFGAPVCPPTVALDERTGVSASLMLSNSTMMSKQEETESVASKPEMSAQPGLKLVRFNSELLNSASLGAAVTWIPTPDVAFDPLHPLALDRLFPMHGVLEYIYSRDGAQCFDCFDYAINTTWKVEPACPRELRELTELCGKEANPYKINSELSEAFKARTSQILVKNHSVSQLPMHRRSLLRAILKAKVKSDTHTPEMIVQALDLQFLTVGAQEFIVGLSGSPKIVAHVDQKLGVTSVATVHRVCRPYTHHPGDYVGITAGNLGRREAHSTRVEIADAPQRHFNGLYELVPSDDCASSPSGTRAQHAKRRVPSSARDRSLSIKSNHNWAKEQDSTSITSSTLDSDVRAATPARSQSSTVVSGSVFHGDRGRNDDVDGFRRLEPPHQVARWSEAKHQWIVFPVSGMAREFVSDKHVTLHLGAYMRDWVLPLMRSVTRSLSLLPAGQKVPQYLYRASVGRDKRAGSVVQCHGQDESIVWTSMTSASASRTLASSKVAAGSTSIIVKLMCKSAHSVSRYSRFAREQEWMIPQNTVFRFDGGRETEWGTPTLALHEVDGGEAMVLCVRGLIASQLQAASSGRDDRKKVDVLMKAISYIEARRLDDALRHILRPLNPDKPLIHNKKVLEIAKKLLSNGAALQIVNEELAIAAYEGHLPCIEPLLQLGAEADYRKNGQTCMERAVLRGHIEIVKIFRPVLAKDITNDLMLIHAAKGNDLAVWVLHEIGMSLELANDQGKMPAQLAHENRHKYTVFLIRLLLSEGQHSCGVPTVSATLLPSLPLDGHKESVEQVLMTACQEGALDSCEAIIRALNPCLARRLVEDLVDMTCLHVAAEMPAFTQPRGIRCLRLMITKVPDLVDHPDGWKRTPLWHAVSKGNIEIAQLLIDSGADIRREDGQGMMPVHVAYKEVIERSSEDLVPPERRQEMRRVFDHQLNIRLNEAGKRYALLSDGAKQGLMRLARTIRDRKPSDGDEAKGCEETSSAAEERGRTAASVVAAGAVGGEGLAEMHSIVPQPSQVSETASHRSVRDDAIDAALASIASSRNEDIAQDAVHDDVLPSPPGFGGRRSRATMAVELQDDRCITTEKVASVAWGKNDDLSVSIFMNFEKAVTMKNFCHLFIAHGPVDETEAQLLKRITMWLELGGTGATLAQVCFTHNAGRHAPSLQILKTEKQGRWQIELDMAEHYALCCRKAHDLDYMAGVFRGRAKGVVESYDYSRFAFVIALVAAVLYQAFVVPFSLTSDPDLSTKQETMFLVFDILCDGILIANFVRYLKALYESFAHEDQDDKATPDVIEEDEQETKADFVPKVFASPTFWLICVPVVPLQLVQVFVHGWGMYGNARTRPWWRVNKLLGMWELRHLGSYVRDAYDLNEYAFTFARYVLLMLYTIYLVSCVLLHTYDAELAMPDGHMYHDTTTPRIMTSFHFVLRNMLGRDVWGQQQMDDLPWYLTLVLLALKMLGVVFQAAFISMLIKMFQVRDLRRGAYVEKVDRICEALEEMPEALRREALEYYKRVWFARGNVEVPQTSEIMDQLNPSLQNLVSIEVAKTMRDEVTYFEHHDHRGLSDLVRHLRHMVCPRRSIICMQGDKGHSVYFIAKGRFAVVKGGCLNLRTGHFEKGERKAELGKGEFFGEMALLPGEEEARRNATIIALEHSEVYVLDKTNLGNLLRSTSSKGTEEFLRVYLHRKRENDHSEDRSPSPHSPAADEIHEMQASIVERVNEQPHAPHLSHNIRRDHRLLSSRKREPSPGITDERSMLSFITNSPRFTKSRRGVNAQSPSLSFATVEDPGSYESPRADARLLPSSSGLSPRVVASRADLANASQVASALTRGESNVSGSSLLRRERSSTQVKRVTSRRVVTANPLTGMPREVQQHGTTSSVGSMDRDSIHSYQSELTLDSRTTGGDDVNTLNRAV